MLLKPMPGGGAPSSLTSLGAPTAPSTMRKSLDDGLKNKSPPKLESESSRNGTGRAKRSCATSSNLDSPFVVMLPFMVYVPSPLAWTSPEIVMLPTV